MALYSFERSRQLLNEASNYLVGGVSSNYRLGISPTPLVLERASGPYLFDADKNRLIDYYLGMGPMILGHSPVEVIEAVIEQVQRGILYAGQSEIEYEAARLVCDLVPCAERIRFASSGTEAVQIALRLARAATGRQTIVKFEGHYHGWLDNILWSVSPPLDQAGAITSPERIPGSVGQEIVAGANVEILSWNDIETLTTRLERRDVAAVIMEPVMCNTSAIAPLPGYLERVREICNATGTILIFDEVITGFRLAVGGAQARLDVIPDLATFGKAIANGFPVACLAGRADLMDMIVTRKVMHGGTYNAQPVAMAATVATLKALSRPGFYSELETRGTRLITGISRAFAQAGLEARVQGYPQIFHVSLGVSSPITNYRDSLQADKPRYVRFTTALLTHGVRALERGAWFISAAHSDDVIDETIRAVEMAALDISQTQSL